MLTTAKKLAIFTVCSFCLVSYANAKESTVLSVGVTSNHASNSYPGAESKTKGYGSIATLSNPVYNGWIGTGIIGYSSNNTDTDTNSRHSDVDVTTLGLAASKYIGNGQSISFSALYGKTSIDSTEIISGTPTSDSIDVNSWIFSGGITQMFPKTFKGYLAVSAMLTNVSNTTKSYTNASGADVSKNKYDITYLTAGVKQTWNIQGYNPYVSLQYNVSNEAFVIQSGDKNYYRWGMGVSKDISKDMILGISFSKIFGKDYASGDSLGFNVIKKF